MYRNKYCLAIGIDQYSHWPRLSNAVNDAMGVAYTLKERYGFTIRQLITPEDTSRSRIHQVLVDEISCDVTSDDLVIVFFAGHGHTIQLPNRKDRGFIVPVEARNESLADLISMVALEEWSDYLKARHVLYIFDSCFSGTATLRSGQSIRDENFFSRRARRVITAGGADQLVEDGLGDHSIFTEVLIRALQGDAADENGTLTGGALYQYLLPRVSKESDFFQMPGEGFFPGHEGGDVLLKPTTTKPAALPVLPHPPPSVGFLGEFFHGTGHTTRSSRVEFIDDPVQLRPEDMGERLFADSGQQWAIIIGTNPEIIYSDSSMTEILDARDVLDWFLNPDIYGEIPPDKISFSIGEAATEKLVRGAMDRISESIDPKDSLLFYFSGHATDFSSTGELLLYDAFKGSRWGDESNQCGMIKADELITWFNQLNARKVVAILDTGGYPFYRASTKLVANRYLISSVNSQTLGRNGWVTWYLNRLVQKSGRSVVLGSIGELLTGADLYLQKERARIAMFPYIASDYTSEIKGT